MMATATLGAPPSTSTPTAATAEFVSLAEARRITGRSAVQIRTLAAVGRVGVDAPGPGCRVRYRRDDLARVAVAR
jgi:hypothetical protein